MTDFDWDDWFLLTLETRTGDVLAVYGWVDLNIIGSEDCAAWRLLGLDDFDWLQVFLAFMNVWRGLCDAHIPIFILCFLFLLFILLIFVLPLLFLLFLLWFFLLRFLFLLRFFLFLNLLNFISFSAWIWVWVIVAFWLGSRCDRIDFNLTQRF